MHVYINKTGKGRASAPIMPVMKMGCRKTPSKLAFLITALRLEISAFLCFYRHQKHPVKKYQKDQVTQKCIFEKKPVVKLACVMKRHLKKVTVLGKRSLNIAAISSSLSPSLSIGCHNCLKLKLSLGVS